jgi:serine/threonine protein kinase/tetratricopeptide (TPR) repeat protein
MLTPELWEKAGHLFQAVLELRPDERMAYLRQACGEDESLRREVESLLAAEERAGDFLDAGALDDAAKALAEEKSVSLVGKRLGHYEVRSLLGAGGMGEVYLAQDTRLDRAVALKILSAEFAADKSRLHRFEQEARSAAALSHAHIAHVYEIGEADGKHYISMEYIDGETLRNKIHREKTALPKLLKYLAQVAAGLAKAHERGIVHRDLKPDNIMITRDGDAKILDFGLAKLIEPRNQMGGGDGVPSDVSTFRISQHTVPGIVMGTVGYMSPEQAQGKVHEIDQRSDIFSFGCILYEAATWMRAFEGKDVLDSLHKIVYAPTPQIKEANAAAPDELQRIVRRCLAKEPEKRYQSIKDVAIELEELLQDLKGVPELEQTVPPAAAGTAETGAAWPTSSAEYVVSSISRHRRAALAAMLLAAGIALVSWYYFHSQDKKVAIHSIAVLPFTNVNKDMEMEYLSDGISESLINRLSRLPDVKVIARSSAFKYKGTELDLNDVAKALGVEAILTGRVTQRGENLSISVELVNAGDKTQLWGDQYDRKMSDLLAIQREIAREIVEKLKLRVSGDEKVLAKHFTESNEAYQLYLKGRFYWNKRTDEALRKSIECFKQAIETDPSFALAYAGLADCYVVPAILLPPREVMPKAKAAAMRALELDETLAEAHASLGRVLAAYDWDWTGAEKEYKRAIELNPRYAIAHQWYGGYLDAMGRHNEAIGERKRALELEPLSLIVNFELGLAYYYARDYDQAIEQFKKTVELDQNFPPPHNFLPASYEQKGMYSEAIAEFKKAIPLTGGSEWTLAKAGLGHAYAVTGQKSEARAVLDELKQDSGQGYVSANSIALIYAGLGEKDEAFAWLEKGYEQRAFQMQWIKIEPRWDSIRTDPRFQDLMRRVGLTQ